MINLSIGNIFASDGLTEAQKIAKIKSDVLKQLGGPTRAGRTVLMEISGQVFFYDRDGNWLISAMATYTPLYQEKTYWEAVCFWSSPKD